MRKRTGARRAGGGEFTVGLRPAAMQPRKASPSLHQKLTQIRGCARMDLRSEHAEWQQNNRAGGGQDKTLCALRN